MPDRTIQSSFFDNETTDSVVSTTTNNNGHCLPERLVSLNHVSTTYFSRNISMSSTKSPKSTSSNAVPMARPFDEFSSNIIISTNPLDEQSFSTITKLDKN